jgi:outer membrane protein OmpA-like peptidoglycan-associated protein
LIANDAYVKRIAKDEGEKPFWISFADLMTALMVLFLLVMSVALLAVTKTVNETEERKAQRDEAIARLLTQVKQATSTFPGASVDMSRGVINFGEKARFETDSSALNAEKAAMLRQYVPLVLDIARNELGRRWLKRIVVEGFADRRGSYLYNLDLSLRRSERVLCELLTPGTPDERPLSQAERDQIRDLFLVGGYSFNSSKSSFEESRRIEFRLEFFGVDEHLSPRVSEGSSEFGTCALKP